MALVLLAGCTGAPALIERSAAPAPAFDAKALWVLSDADMAGTAYADRLLRQIPGQRDALTRVPLVGPATPPASAFASNSVTGWPGSLDIGPGCRFAYVAETRAEVDDAVQKVDNPYTGLPEGKVIAAYDIAGKSAPVPAGSVEIGGNPKSVHVAADGRWLVAPLEKTGSELAFVILDRGRPTEVRYAGLDSSAFQPAVHDQRAMLIQPPASAAANPRCHSSLSIRPPAL